MLKYAKQPNLPTTNIHFRDINRMEVDPVLAKGSKVDRNYPYCFKLYMVNRELVLGAKNLSARQLWINGFNVLFEFRDFQNRKLSNIIPGGIQNKPAGEFKLVG